MQTGIKNLDLMMGGGIPEGNQVIIAGGPGTGKTLMSVEFLYNNALAGETGVLFSLEEDTEMILENVKSAFPNFKKIDDLIADKKLTIYGNDIGKTYMAKDVDKDTYAFGNWIANIESVISEYGATRVVIDSMSAIKLLLKDPFEYRDTSLELVRILRKAHVTSLLTVELETPEKERLIFQPEFFIYDGIIALYLAGEGSNRTLSMEVIKMRGSGHSFNIVPYEFTPDGIVVIKVPGEI
ncbi:MAG: ATPase domain-containing protein [Candidatus Micrarchaeia archaeon]